MCETELTAMAEHRVPPCRAPPAGIRTGPRPRGLSAIPSDTGTTVLSGEDPGRVGNLISPGFSIDNQRVAEAQLVAQALNDLAMAGARLRRVDDTGIDVL